MSKQISAINAKLLAAGGSGNSSNALLDQRDLLIDQLSEICQISVNYINKGAAQIRLGNTGSGPVIVEPNQQFRLVLIKVLQLFQLMLLNKVQASTSCW